MARTSVESSSDDDYKGVELISESEEDEPSVEQAEEQIIIDSEEDTELAGVLAPPTIGWGDFDLDDDPLPADITMTDEHDAHTNPYFASEIEIFNAASAFNRDPSEAASESKRVRFTDDLIISGSTSSSHSEEDEDVFPDLFMQQDQLDPHFRSIIENDQDADDGASMSTDGEGSCWDFRGSDDNDIHDIHDNKSDCGSSAGSSSGYESDEGETTDEDLPPPQSIARTRSVLRRPSTSSIDLDDDTPLPFRRPSKPNTSRRVGPSLGSWVADPSKPIAVIDSTGKRMIIYPAQRPTIKDSNLFGPPTSSNSSFVSTSPQPVNARVVDDSEMDRSDFSNQENSTTLIGSGTNLMMGGLLQGIPGHEYLLGGHILGPPEAFYPFMTIGQDGAVIENDIEEDDDDDEGMLNVNDFIDFGDDSSGSEKEDGGLQPPPTTPVEKASVVGGNVPSLSSSRNAKETSANSMLHHFDRGVVTAFRRDQHRHKLLHSRPSLRTHPSFGPSPFANGIIKGGRYAAANKPISPRRKQRLRSSSGSALIGFEAKRRAAVNAHRRHKSGLF
ncbi:MAG: hypothetical protein M1833_001732 [Piccolia ochrophora]|nr:MAG: hypothetical protein M1833_001732 [Piccolia ochrophora]